MAIAEVKLGAVQRAGHYSSLQLPFPESSSHVRTGAVGGVKLISDSSQEYVTSFGSNLFHLSLIENFLKGK
jgi:hypothetical protein